MRRVDTRTLQTFIERQLRCTTGRVGVKVRILVFGLYIYPVYRAKVMYLCYMFKWMRWFASKPFYVSTFKLL